MPAPGPFFLHDGPLPVAHRGGAGVVAGNSWRAVEFCATNNLYLETDISITPDGEVVLWHPTGLDRLRPRRASHRTSPGDAPPRLGDVLASFPSLRMFVDVKKWPAVEPVARLIARADATDRICVGTFSRARTASVVSAVRDLTGRSIPAALGPGQTAALLLRSILGLRYRPDAGYTTVQPPHTVVGRRFVAAAHGAGLAVIPWTVNRPNRMRKLLLMGVDGMMTDHPALLTAVLGRR